MVAHDLGELRRVMYHHLVLLQVFRDLLAVHRNVADVEWAEVVVVALVEEAAVKVEYLDP